MERGVISDEAIENGEWHRWFEQCRPKVDNSYKSGNQDEEDKQETNHVEPGHENGGEVSSANDCPDLAFLVDHKGYEDLTPDILTMKCNISQ